MPTGYAKITAGNTAMTNDRRNESGESERRMQGGKGGKEKGWYWEWEIDWEKK
jgi:hypothetical protein